MTGPAPASPERRALALVERSPALVLAQDKAGWLALFADGAAVEDPVGSAPNVRGARRSAAGEDDLGRFYDTFIAGNEIRFEVRGDWVAGAEVARDVLIHTRLASGLRLTVPAHLLYEVDFAGAEPRLRRMRAVWDLRQRTRGALGAGWLGLRTLIDMSVRMLSVQGLGGTLRYSRGMFVGIFGAGTRAAVALARAVAASDAAAVEALFAPGARVELPVGTPLQPSGLAAALGGELHIEPATAAGWLTSFRFEAGKGRRGLCFLEFDPGSRRIAQARFFA